MWGLEAWFTLQTHPAPLFTLMGGFLGIPVPATGQKDSARSKEIARLVGYFGDLPEKIVIRGFTNSP